MHETVVRIEALYEAARNSIEEKRYYDTFVCMLEREKAIVELANGSFRDHTALDAILRHTHEIALLLQVEIGRYERAVADLTLHAPAYMAYARAATLR